MGLGFSPSRSRLDNGSTIKVFGSDKIRALGKEMFSVHLSERFWYVYHAQKFLEPSKESRGVLGVIQRRALEKELKKSFKKLKRKLKRIFRRALKKALKRAH